MTQAPKLWYGWRRICGCKWACVATGETEQRASEELLRYLRRESKDGYLAVTHGADRDPQRLGIVGQFYRRGLPFANEFLPEG
jgi:hypothetical protein